MVTIKKAIGVMVQVILIISMMVSSFVPSARAQAQPKNSASVSATSDIRDGITLGDNRPALITETVPILSEEIAKQAQAQTPIETPLQIKLSAEPEIYTIGKPVIIKWEIVGGTAEQLANLSIIARPPDGVTPLNAQDVPNTDGSVLISPKAGRGTSVWKVLDYAAPPLFFSFELVLNGEVINQGEIMIDQPLAEAGKGQNSKVTSRDGKVNVSVPSNATASSLLMDVRAPSPQALRGSSLSWNPVEIIAVDKNSQKNVKKFSNPITIQIKYDESNIFDWNEEDLSIYYYDPDLMDWFPMATSVDSVNNILTVQSDHLTVFDYKANNWQSQMLPTVDSFKVSDFTGAGTYAINMWTPPGQGGLQPSLALAYNSQIIDESSAFSQPSWVGMGWSLETGAITRNMHGTDDTDSDDTFSISANGISGLLLPISVNGTIETYNTADQSFVKVERDTSNNKWNVWGKDGTKYEFAQAARTSTSNGCASANQLNITWKWSLTSVTNPRVKNASGTPIPLTYSYDVEKKSTTCYNEIAVYPLSITYPSGSYSIWFDTEARNDYQTSWTQTTSRTLFGTKRLNQIRVLNAGAVIRRYDLTYAANTDANIIYQNFTWTGAAKTSTLVKVQEYGLANLPLPPVTFDYSVDHMHLNKVDNGQGGAVEMSYRSWDYQDQELENKDLRQFRTAFGSNECTSNTPRTTWTKQEGAAFGCEYRLANGTLTGFLMVGGPLNGASNNIVDKEN